MTIYLNNNGAIGEIPTGKNYFSRKFKEIRLKCDDLTPFYTLYSYRHTFALNFMMEPLENENNEDKRFELMGVLGHSKFETTEIYLKGFPKELVSKSKWQGMKHWRQK
jgi:integrase